MEQTTVTRPLPRDAGPVELDVLQIALVAGGLPRSGWGDPNALPLTTAESSLPSSDWDF